MRSLFLDTNVVIDFVDTRHPGFSDVKQLLELARSGTVELHTSTLSIATAAYVLRREPEPVIRAKLRGFVARVKLVELSAEQIDSGLNAASAFTDIEDAFQHAAAHAAGCGVILTRDTDDFATSTLPVMTPADFLRQR